MKRGLVIGKFMPVHKGHVALIEFAASQCDELIVSMSYTLSDPIDPGIRHSWMDAIFHDRPTIRVEMVLDDFDNETLPIDERTKLWAAFIRNRYPRIDVLYSSEEYGVPFARDLAVPHVAFDVLRKQFPVSGSGIRTRPFHYWAFIPDVVRSYFVKKVCFYGPESTGKSVMAARMAEWYQTEFVPEAARDMITGNHFTPEDFEAIGREQTERVLYKARHANKVLFCDTDLITTQIYARHYLGFVPPALHELEKMVQYDQYFLFDVDVPWVSDELRDMGGDEKRKQMVEVFRKELEQRRMNYVVVQGTWAERGKVIRDSVDRIISSTS